MAFTDHAGDVDPGIVGAISGRPDHNPNILQEAVVGEADRAALGVHQPRPEPHPRPLQPPAVAPNDELPAAHPPAEPGIDRDPQ
jgi:hypothetical protein